MAAPQVVIEERFRGPPESGNGGYTCGRLAAHMDAPVVEVTLRLPPPLERALEVEHDGDAVRLRDGEAVVAEARAATLDLQPPEPPRLAEAAEASGRPAIAGENHPFPGCFVCGPRREPGDGLRIFPGHLPDRPLLTAPWTPDESVTAEDGLVPPELVWAALDCPTAAPVANPNGDPPIVLARMTAELHGRARGGEPHVLGSWAIASDGRKRHAGSAIWTADGELRGIARALWIELKRG